MYLVVIIIIIKTTQMISYHLKLQLFIVTILEPKIYFLSLKLDNLYSFIHVYTFMISNFFFLLHCKKKKKLNYNFFTNCTDTMDFYFAQFIGFE